ncbi:hypothetical protein NK131_003045, partial [Escherichia coli]|nr:hypothetical protein [Escherichia coli]
VCVVGKMRDLILQLSKSSIYSTKPLKTDRFETINQIGKNPDIEKQMYGKFLKYKADIDNDSLMKARGDKPEAVTWG